MRNEQYLNNQGRREVELMLNSKLITKCQVGVFPHG